MMKHDTVRRVIGPTILLKSGNYFDFESPETSIFTIDDIAHGLALTCRFSGHCDRHYSVAQHSVHVSEIVAPAYAYQGLMHDAAEAFVGDMTKPLKALVSQFCEIEKRVELVVFNRFGVGSPMPEAVKEADVLMLVTEQRLLMCNRDDWQYGRGRVPLDIELPVLSPMEAKRLFLKRFMELKP